MKHSDYVDFLKSYLFKTITKKAFTVIITKLPFLAWGPLAPLLQLIIDKLVGIILDQTELAVFMKYIDIRTTLQGRDFYKAMEDNQLALKNGSDNDKKIAEQNLKDTFRAFVKLTN